MAGEAPPDDGKIGDNELLYRRVRSDQIEPTRDGKGIRPSSAVLKSSGGPLSVHVASLITPEELLKQYGSFHIAAISAKVARSEKCRLRHEADESGDPAHAHIYGDSPDGSLKAGQASKIAHQTQIILNPKLPPPVVGGQ